jgi:predicted  nucleic acid-binding Zn-ribbon protein
MRVRHRTPTIFNLSMVDVLCCALGCMIMLWLLNLREAKEKAEAAGQTSQLLWESETQLDNLTSLLLSMTTERDSLTEERDRLHRDWQAVRTELAATLKDLMAMRSQYSDAQQRLARLTREQGAMAQEKANVQKELTVLEAQLRDREKQAKTSTLRMDTLASQLRDAEARARQAEERLQSLEGELRDRKKELTEASRNINQLQQDKKSLADQANRARAAAENRFEGIALTGRRVLFMVDMSGSMELVDEKTPDENKWIGVRETVFKIMRSLPDLEKFQVIIFANKTSYLLGNDGQWLDYDPRTSADLVLKKLAAIKPKGGTNMTDAFESAFGFRSIGLDTIYVLSDGLPNMGPGLTAEQANLPEPERSDILAKHIRGLLRKDWNRSMPGRPRVRINAIGFFFESPDVGAFLWALARENDGSFVGMSKP